MKNEALIRGVACAALAFGMASSMSGCLDFWGTKPKPVVTAAGLPTHPKPKPEPTPAPPSPVPEPPKPEPPKPSPTSIPTARPVPGKPGFVFSPFNNQPIDVTDFASGNLVADPRYPLAERKYFRVP